MGETFDTTSNGMLYSAPAPGGLIMEYGRFRIHLLTLAIILVMLSGCYPKRVGPIGPEGKKLTWQEMSLSERKAHMRREVLPIAADIFSTWQPERFATVDCSLCHSRGETEGIYKMPTADLPRLSGALLLGPEFARAPDTTQLKLDRLVPEMAEALGHKPFSLLTRQGFGCYSCHLGPAGPMYGN